MFLLNWPTLVLGAANWIDKHTVDVIEPLGLRAPEVILGSGCAEMRSGVWAVFRMINQNFAAEHNITEEQEVVFTNDYALW